MGCSLLCTILQLSMALLSIGSSDGCASLQDFWHAAHSGAAASVSAQHHPAVCCAAPACLCSGGMYRGSVDQTGKMVTAIFPEDDPQHDQGGGSLKVDAS